MQIRRRPNDEDRLGRLRAMLNHQRNLALERVRELRRDQEQEALPPPADEMDVARSLADIETHASVIERAEERLKAIDFAFNRLEQGRYGICARCGDEIALERIRALPFAVYCLECQEKRDRQAQANKLWVDEPFLHQWDLPEEMEETTETSRDEAFAFATEEMAARPARRGRPKGSPSKQETTGQARQKGAHARKPSATG